MKTRYQILQIDSEDSREYTVIDSKTGVTLFYSGPDYSPDRFISEHSRQRCKSWLDTNLPDWQDPTKYWTTP